jgi:hypothetical protein
MDLHLARMRDVAEVLEEPLSTDLERRRITAPSSASSTTSQRESSRFVISSTFAWRSVGSPRSKSSCFQAMFSAGAARIACSAGSFCIASTAFAMRNRAERSCRSRTASSVSTAFLSALTRASASSALSRSCQFSRWAQFTTATFVTPKRSATA